MTTPRPSQPIRLYNTPLSGHGHRVALFMSLLDLPYETINLNMQAGDNLRPEFLAINPFGQVPVIEDGDVRITDSTAILVYLALRYADPAWLPRDPVDAAAVQRWLSLASGQIAYGPNQARLVKVFGAPHDYARAYATALKLFELLDHEFSTRAFAIGATPTIADIAAYSYIALAPEGDISLEPYPHLRAWLKRVEALPRFLARPKLPPKAIAA